MKADTLTVNVTTRVSRTLLEIMRKRLRRARAEVVELEHVVSVLGRLAGEHFDVCEAKRAQAIAAGAQEVSARELARITLARRGIET